MDELEPQLRPRKITILAFGEGEGEKIFLRHLVALYRRKGLVHVATSCAGGGTLRSIFNQMKQFRRGEKRDHEFIFLDKDLGWDDETIQSAYEEEVELVGNDPCLEAFFLEILDEPIPHGSGSGKHKDRFRALCRERDFNEEECERLFPKSVLNAARKRIPKLDTMIKRIEGDLT